MFTCVQSEISSAFFQQHLKGNIFLSLHRKKKTNFKVPKFLGTKHSCGFHILNNFHPWEAYVLLFKICVFIGLVHITQERMRIKICAGRLYPTLCSVGVL